MKNDTVSKSEIIAGLLRDEVFREAKANGKLPPVCALAQRFGASPKTICAALAALEAKGEIKSVKGSGSYLAKRRGAPAKALRMVGASIPCYMEGHIEFAAHMTRFLQESNYMPCLFDGYNAAALRSMLPAFLESQPFGLIVNGDSRFPYEFLDQLDPATRLVFIGEFEGPRRYDASYVLYDIKGGGALATRQLLKLGRRRIGVANFEVQPGWSSAHFWEGCKEALSESGVTAAFHVNDTSLSTAAAEALLSGPERPDALLGIQDHMLLPFLEAAKRLGLRVPDDLAIIGGGDTDWAVQFDLSTLDNMQRELSREAVAALAASDKVELAIMPRIVVRGSCPLQ